MTPVEIMSPVGSYESLSAAIAAGADGLFLETHQDPSVAKSDGANMLRLDLLEGLLTRLTRLRAVINEIDNKC